MNAKDTNTATSLSGDLEGLSNFIQATLNYSREGERIASAIRSIRRLSEDIIAIAENSEDANAHYAAAVGSLERAARNLSEAFEEATLKFAQLGVDTGQIGRPTGIVKIGGEE